MKQIKGETKSGFKFSVNESITDDMELIDIMAGIEKDASNMSLFVTKVLGDDKQKKDLYEHVRNKDGIVQSSKVYEEILEIFEFVAGEDSKN